MQLIKLLPRSNGKTSLPSEKATVRSRFNPNLEALRAVAALVVVWHHAIIHEFQLDPAYKPNGIAGFNPPGHFSVLIFFVLSGYVISLAHKKALTWATVGTYLRKRFTRIYPIYVLSLSGALIVAGFAYSLYTVIAHLLFGQMVLAPLISENNPLWSLQYEIFFYLLFVPLSMLRVQPIMVAIVTTLLSFVALYLGTKGIGGSTYSYLIGFSFWALGWSFGSLRNTRAVNYTLLLSTIFFLLAIDARFNVLQIIYNRLLKFATSDSTLGIDLVYWPEAFIYHVDFASLPFAAFIILQFIGYDHKNWKWISLLFQILPAYTLVYIARHYSEGSTVTAIMPAIFYLLSTFLFFIRTEAIERVSKWIIVRLIPLGGISYGLYVIHFPILSAFHRIHLFSGNGYTFAARFVFYVLMSLSVAYWLEKQFQPWIKKYL
ncbi:acyltransferase family protein [Hymenobacter weizhouensis]|uniref:acyltransferase family protein n=1 Tax=Hymenobacter sp. YIM 151500-1 TaxID=2987689 RepID=UPI002228034F|nr:acyltransferase [Hymenobacter sp. YIM 151500-1]UYZ61365.1 acyltransferase [Hymenobacter sp. YIM 151500-1]